jgi:hypothetical protein
MLPKNAYALPKHREATVLAARKLAEECLNGRRKLPENVTFYIVPGESFRTAFSADLAGLTSPTLRTVYIAEGFEGDVRVYAHELIHTSGVLGHPKEYFKDCNLYD